jgi:hypothetical protein
MKKEKKPPTNNAPADRIPTRLAVMTVNPYLLHAYWQISVPDLDQVQGALGESMEHARPVLRFYDITSILFDGTNAHETFDVEVDLRTMAWDVPIWSADKSYVIDLGYKTSDDRFYQIVRSNIVHVPRAEPSPRLADRYLRVEQGQIKGRMEKDRGAPPNQKRDPVKVTDFDLVRQTEAAFFFGVSSRYPSPGTNA